MTNFPKVLLIAACAVLPAFPVLAMPGGDHMKMEHKMSASQMKKLTACKAMDHAMAMKNKRCMKLMKTEEMNMQHGMAPDGAMGDHKM